MLYKENQQTPGKRRSAKAKGVTKRRSLSALFEQNGDYDGRLFHSRDKMTYTYLYQGEVVALHFDSVRREFFLKGHHINSLVDPPEVREHLQRFRAAIIQQTRAHSFLPVFDTVIAGLCQSAGLTAL